MTTLPIKYSSVLIVDGYSLTAIVLADHFRSLGAKVHVVNSTTAAGVLIRNKKIDIAFVGYRLPAGDVDLKKILDESGVPHIFCATQAEMGDMSSQLGAAPTIN